VVSSDFGSLTTVDVAQLPSTSVFVQPIGAIEQHGPHLPLITDALIAQSIAERASARATSTACLMPTVSYGKSTEHLGYPGTIALSAETLIALCRSKSSWPPPCDSVCHLRSNWPTRTGVSMAVRWRHR
jgi:creatinine amidohydrolase/Fe(II)-dependent formamide hydrolase-like protein